MLYFLVEQNLKDIEAEFENMVYNVQKAFINSSVDLNNLLMKLKTSSATENKQVPLFETNYFGDVTSMKALFKALSYHWNLYDHDMLAFLIDAANCDMASKIYHAFVNSVDLLAFDLVNHCSDIEMAPGYKALQIKLKKSECTIKTVEKIKKMIVQHYELKNYAIVLKTVTKGCLNIQYQTSDLVMVYINNSRPITVDFKNRLIYEAVVIFNGTNLQEDAREVCTVFIVINVYVYIKVETRSASLIWTTH